VGRFQPASLVLDDPRWRDIEAVKKRQVLEIPAGVFFWDGGTECGLLLLYLAKHLHPDLFPDLDLRAEVRRYYRRFYRTAISDHEADLLLSGRDPQGKRGNPWGI
jgi:iron complex transport system substrate-binding protein